MVNAQLIWSNTLETIDDTAASRCIRRGERIRDRGFLALWIQQESGHHDVLRYSTPSTSPPSGPDRSGRQGDEVLDIRPARGVQIQADRGLSRTVPRPVPRCGGGPGTYRPNRHRHERRTRCQHRSAGRLWAQTYVFNRIMPDEERHYAGLVSTALDIEHDVLVVDRYECRDRFWDTPEAQAPEPQVRIFSSAFQEGDRMVAARTRVMMSGQGADEGLRGPRDYFVALIREGRLGRWGLDVGRHIRGIVPEPVDFLIF